MLHSGEADMRKYRDDEDANNQGCLFILGYIVAGCLGFLLVFAVSGNFPVSATIGISVGYSVIPAISMFTVGEILADSRYKYDIGGYLFGVVFIEAIGLGMVLLTTHQWLTYLVTMVIALLVAYVLGYRHGRKEREEDLQN